LRAGAPIQDLNAVRIPLSLVKGGGFRREIAAGRVITLILSDVLSNDPRIIASGPTIAGTHSAREALQTLETYDLIEHIAPQVISFLRQSDEPPESVYPYDVVRIVGDNATAIDAAMEHCRSIGRHARIVWRQVEGEASELGRTWVDLLSQEQLADVLIGGGEATVTVRGDGLGGRNTEFALAAALELDRRGLAGWTVASLATDGQDALTDAAGAIVDGELIRRARARGLDPADALRRNDSGSLLKALGCLVMPGPTGTNVNDLYFAVRDDAT
ncbi:MAG: glycerate kinase, partial [Thermomicrobiales bacterium]